MNIFDFEIFEPAANVGSVGPVAKVGPAAKIGSVGFVEPNGSTKPVPGPRGPKIIDCDYFPSIPKCSDNIKF